MTQTLDAALREAARGRWRKVRNPRGQIGRAEAVVRTLEKVMLRGSASPQTACPRVSKVVKAGSFSFPIWTGSTLPNADLVPHRTPGAGILVASVKKEHVRRAVDLWLGSGLKESTVLAYLNTLSALGVDVTECRPRLPRPLKWWLTPAHQEAVLAFLAENPTPRKQALADLVSFTTQTGLRIEESLRLRWADVHDRPTRTSITVAGTKTQMSQATIPITAEAAAVLARRRALGGERVFPVAYHQMQQEWAEARQCFGLENPKVATLKALRRSAARYLHASKGMPLDMLRQMLRHENVQTTMGYLRLTGGYGEDELARWL